MEEENVEVTPEVTEEVVVEETPEVTEQLDKQLLIWYNTTNSSNEQKNYGRYPKRS